MLQDFKIVALIFYVFLATADISAFSLLTLRRQLRYIDKLTTLHL
ncbi:hypothetical protein Desac_1518 [Desulfobacca acetoxidans DSM 11109]|uniref:Uncharacterized protein n=1 Tax=Desulfobacca acetoxidans (strain ATCC 700848 / DSM 11109 / ASRB2) TaxID=880072 RepID=F2NCU2_DESAR|nr:hypothetical protein Desac_1518 [Desulfobacca acetoxidans DSM 11109]